MHYLDPKPGANCGFCCAYKFPGIGTDRAPCMKSSMFSMKAIIFGTKSIMFGVKSIVFGVKSIVFGVKSIMFGVKPPAISQKLLPENRVGWGWALA